MVRPLRWRKMGLQEVLRTRGWWRGGGRGGIMSRWCMCLVQVYAVRIVQRLGVNHIPYVLG